jgi:hypothetical protein
MRDGEIADDDARLLSWQYVAIVEIVMTDYAQSRLGSAERCVDHALKMFFGGVASKSSH